MKSRIQIRPCVLVILAVVAITVRSTSAQDQWNDMSNSDEKNVAIITDAGLGIESLNCNGELTWTNWATNATYRVEWAGSLAGPWTNFDALANLSSIAASDTTVTVTVPMFYRVIWTDPPSPPPLVGNWHFDGHDNFHGLVVTVTGLVSITGTTGTWTFGAGTNSWRLFCTSGNISHFSGSGGSEIWIYLDACYLAEGAFALNGTWVGDSYSGTWYQSGVWLQPIGTFSLFK